MVFDFKPVPGERKAKKTNLCILQGGQPFIFHVGCLWSEGRWSGEIICIRIHAHTELVKWGRQAV